MARAFLFGVLLFVSGILGGVYLDRWSSADTAVAGKSADGSVSWTSLSPDDRRVAAVFGIAQISGVRAALDSLDAASREAPGLRARGHSIAHALGRFVVDRAGGDPAVFAECREFFQAGCFHGVLEGYFATRPVVDSAAVAALCASVVQPGAAPLLRQECAHGLGHGLMGRFTGDVPASLAHCEYAGPPEARRECYDGVYMELAIRATSSASSAPGSAPGADHAGHDMASMAAPAAYDCAGVADQYQASCWSYQPIVALARYGPDVARAAAECASAGQLGAAACDQGLGKQLLGRSIDNPAAVARTCRDLGNARAGACLAGVVEGLLDTDWRGDAPAAFCASLSAAERPPCQAAIVERRRLLDG